jgi:hypothetical protein
MCSPTSVKYSVAELDALSFSTFEFRDNECRERHTLLMNVKVCSQALYTPFSDLEIILKQCFRKIPLSIFVFCENWFSLKRALFMGVNEIYTNFLHIPSDMRYV